MAKTNYCCPKCGYYKFKTSKVNGVKYWTCQMCEYETTDPNEIIDDVDDYISSACRACGNPAYPKCMDSCKMYDD